MNVLANEIVFSDLYHVLKMNPSFFVGKIPPVIQHIDHHRTIITLLFNVI